MATASGNAGTSWAKDKGYLEKPDSLEDAPPEPARELASLRRTCLSKLRVMKSRTQERRAGRAGRARERPSSSLA